MLELSRVIPVAIYEANGVIEGIEEFKEVTQKNAFDKEIKKGFYDWTPLRSDRIAVTYLSEIELFIPEIAKKEGEYEEELIRITPLRGIIIVYNSAGYIDLIGSDINISSMKRSVLDLLFGDTESELKSPHFPQERIHKIFSMAQQITRVGYFLPISAEDKLRKIKRYDSYSDFKRYSVIAEQIRKREQEEIFAFGGKFEMNRKQISLYINFTSGRITFYNRPTSKLRWEDIFEMEDLILR